MNSILDLVYRFWKGTGEILHRYESDQILKDYKSLQDIEFGWSESVVSFLYMSFRWLYLKWPQKKVDQLIEDVKNEARKL